MSKLTITAEQLGLGDEETTVFRIGRHNWRVAPLRFQTVKLAFDPLNAFMEQDRSDAKTMFEAVSAILAVVALGIVQTRREAIRFAEDTEGQAAAAALDEALPKLPSRAPGPDGEGGLTSAEVLALRLEEDLYPDEVEGVHDSVFDMIARSGLRLGEFRTEPAGEPAPAEATPLTETSTALSPNSSPEAAEPGAK